MSPVRGARDEQVCSKGDHGEEEGGRSKFQEDCPLDLSSWQTDDKSYMYVQVIMGEPIAASLGTDGLHLFTFFQPKDNQRFSSIETITASFLLDPN